MTATAMATTHEKTLAYHMPRADIGDIVVWYCEGDTNQTPTAGRVVEVCEKSIGIRIEGVNGATSLKSSVSHVTDPRLIDNEHIRRFGAWDYSPMMKRIMDLTDRVKFLEELVSSTPKK